MRSLGAQVIRGLTEANVVVDLFLDATPDPELDLGSPAGMHIVDADAARWQWEGGQWYSRTPMTSFATRQVSRLLRQRSMLDELAAAHARAPYDFWYRFSQIEVPARRSELQRLPPMVLHPGVHAAGELRWHRRERALSRACEPVVLRAAVDRMLSGRARMQQNIARRARAIISMSDVFSDLLRTEYGLQRVPMATVPAAVDLERFVPAESSGWKTNLSKPYALFVSRLAVRKGVELVVELSRRLGDLAGEFKIVVVGDRAPWSNYRPLLADADPRILDYRGPLGPDAVAALMRDARMLLQPSWYEPFGLTVAEALASGTPVVTTTAVGASEGVDARVCRRVHPGSVVALDAEVRRLLALGPDELARCRVHARAEAERLFNAPTMGRRISEFLASIGSRGGG